VDKEEILSRRISNIKEWRPHPRQEDFLQVPYEVFEVLYGGALGGGKSEVGLVWPVVNRTVKSNIPLYQHPGFVGIIFRRTNPQLEKSLIPRARLMYEPLGAKYNETKKLFTFPNKDGILKAGGKVFLSHMENEKDVLDHDTNEYNYVFIDQAEQFTEFMLRYIASRIRSSNPDLPAVYRLSANPGGESHIYLRDRFVKPEPAGNVILDDAATKTKRMFIPAKLDDNPSLKDNDPDYINRLMLLPEEERKAKIEGDWFSFTGQMFSEFRTKHIPGEPDNAVHVCAPFLIPEFWPRILAIDWGFKAKTFAIWAAISPDKRLYIYRCYTAIQKTTRIWASDIARLSQNENIVRNPLDPGCWQEHRELTIAQEYEQYSKLRPEKADNDRHSGVQLIHEYLRFNPRPPRYTPEEGYDSQVAAQIMRLRGLKAHEEYVNLFKPEEPETNLPILQIFNPSPATGTLDLIETIPLAQYDEKDREDYAEFDGDDPLDCLRYLLKASEVYIEEVLNKTKYFEREADIHRQLSETGDMHSFYMRMANLEKSKRSLKPRPVRRFSRHA
jgi:hypothetical protein